MNPERPTDPREQLEVRITALLLGEASAFEEAELLDAIKHDPALAAYYEAMRQTVKRVEETIQLTPVEAAATHSTLSEERRGKLEALFKQPAPTKAVKLDSRAGRTRRLGWPQHAAAIAAAMVILLCVIGLLLPSLAKPKAKASRMAALNQARELELEERILELDSETQSPPATPSVASASTGEPAIVDADAEGKSLARFGSSQNVDRSSRPAKTQAGPPAKPADIYLPAAAVDTAGVPVQMYADGAERGLAADNTVRYYFRNGRDAALKDGAPVEGEAVVAGSPMPAFVVPAPSAVQPKPAPAPSELQTGRPGLLTDSLARKGDAAVESETVPGRKLAAPALESTVKSEALEPRQTVAGASTTPVVEDETRRRQLSVAGANFGDFDGAALPADGVRGRAGEAMRGVQVDGLAALGSVVTSELDRNAVLASPTGVGGNQGGGGGVRGWSEGRSAQPLPSLAGADAVVAGEPVAPGGPANAPTAAGQSLGFFDAPATGAPVAAFGNQAHTANTWHADFGATAGKPAIESAGRGVVADDFVVNGQDSTELFAKQQMDSKSVERLDRLGEETSLGLTFKEAKVPTEPMYEERLLTEQRQLDRKRVKELSDQLAVRGESTKEQLEREAAELKLVQLGVADYDESTLRNELFSLVRERQGPEDKVGLNETAFDTQSRFDTLAQMTTAPNAGNESAREVPATAQGMSFGGGGGGGGGFGGGGSGPQMEMKVERMKVGQQVRSAEGYYANANSVVREFLQAAGVELQPHELVLYDADTAKVVVNAGEGTVAQVGRIVEALKENNNPNPLSGLIHAKEHGLLESNAEHYRNKLATTELNETQLTAPTFERVPLSEVVMELNRRLQNQDRTSSPPQIEMLTNDLSSFPATTLDPATGQPVALGEWSDLESTVVNLTLPEGANSVKAVLDAVVAAADQPIEYRVENGRVLFVPGVKKQISPEAAKLSSLEPLPEIRTADNAFSTFSLNVSDVSFQLAASSLENGQMPDGARLRSEEFINAFDYRDPLPAPGQRVAFNWERARNPFAHNRELLRLSVQTAAAGREPGQPLNLVLLLDNSGSMERADRVQITEQMLRVLAAGLNDYDRISVISFARTPRLIVDGLPGGNHQALIEQITGLNPDGGTNLEDALKLGYETAAKHFQANGNNRVILITDGAANLGNVDPAQLRERVIDQRKRGIALDCFGVGWEGYNDNLLESLSRNGDGRYGFLNDAGNAVFEFSRQLAGALQVAAADVKAQVEFNPNRVTVYRQIGYQQHQLTKEQFRDNTVDAAEIGAAEAGNALYSVEINPNGSGPIGTFRARYRVPSTGQYEEKEWVLDYTPVAPELEKSGPAMRLASTSAAFAEWLANSPYAQTVSPDALQNLLRDVPETFAPDPRPAKLQAMIQQARAISGR